jgi:hypothetical protein
VAFDFLRPALVVNAALAEKLRGKDLLLGKAVILTLTLSATKRKWKDLLFLIGARMTAWMLQRSCSAR